MSHIRDTHTHTHTHTHMLINVDSTGQIQKNESDIDSRPSLRTKIQQAIASGKTIQTEQQQWLLHNWQPLLVEGRQRDSTTT